MTTVVREATVRLLKGVTLTRFLGRPTFKRLNKTRDEVTALLNRQDVSPINTGTKSILSFAVAGGVRGSFT